MSGVELSRPQKEALAWLASRGRDGAEPERVVTWRSLIRLGAVETTADGFRLTVDGECLAERACPRAVRGTPIDPEASQRADARLAEAARNGADDSWWEADL